MISKAAIFIEVIVLITIVAYFPIFNGFFQQDEWLSFAYHSEILSRGTTGYFAEVFSPTVGHYQPFNTLVISFVYQLFKLNYFAYAVLSLFLHLSLVLLIFYLAKILFNDLTLSFFTALLFGISASIYQGTAWVMANFSVQIASILGLLSIIFFLQYLNKQKNKYLIYSVIFFIISLLFKEITLGIFVVFLGMVLIFQGSNFKRFKKTILIILLVAGFYVLIRLWMFVLPQSYEREISFSQSQQLRTTIYNIVTYPLKTLPQSLIPVEILLSSSYSISDLLPSEFVGEPNTTKRDLIVQKWILEFLSVFIFLTFVVLFILLAKRNPKNHLVKIGLFGLLLVLFNSQIFAFAPEREGRVTIVDSRNLYFLNIGSVIFFLSCASLIFKNITYLTFAVLITIIANIFFLRFNLESTNLYAKNRKEILTQINNENPHLGKKVIFFTKSDKSYFGLPEEEKILPFQSGFGQTLIVWYFSKGELPVEFLKNKYLWGITEQGYKESEGFGFGYFRDTEELEKTLNKYNIPKESVIAYEWNSKSGKLTNISNEIREKI